MQAASLMQASQCRKLAGLGERGIASRRYRLGNEKLGLHTPQSAAAPVALLIDGRNWSPSNSW